ncbi:DUF603 domain-containing protein, partial [Borreliella burgdorferi]|nr:DUF603 domain-containing protein [Borreliella burgdorferi]
MLTIYKLNYYLEKQFVNFVILGEIVLKRAKRSFDDYAAYFSEGLLSDVEIADKLGVSKVNVWRMRQKWESG